MSINSAIQFLEQLKTDENLWDEHSSAVNRDDRHQIIVNAGFDFTDDELYYAIENQVEKLIKKRYQGIIPLLNKQNV